MSHFWATGLEWGTWMSFSLESVSVSSAMWTYNTSRVHNQLNEIPISFLAMNDVLCLVSSLVLLMFFIIHSEILLLKRLSVFLRTQFKIQTVGQKIETFKKMGIAALLVGLVYSCLRPACRICISFSIIPVSSIIELHNHHLSKKYCMIHLF